MNNKKYFFVFFGLLLFFSSKSLSFSLNEAIELSLKNNLQLKAKGIHLDINALELKSLKSAFNPFFHSKLTGILLQKPNMMSPDQALKTKTAIFDNSLDKRFDFGLFMKIQLKQTRSQEPTMTFPDFSNGFDPSKFNDGLQFKNIERSYTELRLNLIQPLNKNLGKEVGKIRQNLNINQKQELILNKSKTINSVIKSTILKYLEIFHLKKMLNQTEKEIEFLKAFNQNISNSVMVGLQPEINLSLAKQQLSSARHLYYDQKSKLNNKWRELLNHLGEKNLSKKFPQKLNQAILPDTKAILDLKLEIKIKNNWDLKTLKLKLKTLKITQAFYENQIKSEFNLGLSSAKFGSADQNLLKSNKNLITGNEFETAIWLEYKQSLFGSKEKWELAKNIKNQKLLSIEKQRLFRKIITADQSLASTIQSLKFQLVNLENSAKNLLILFEQEKQKNQIGSSTFLQSLQARNNLFKNKIHQDQVKVQIKSLTIERISLRGQLSAWLFLKN